MRHNDNELLIQAQKCELSLESKTGSLLISQFPAPDWDDIYKLPYPYVGPK